MGRIFVDARPRARRRRMGLQRFFVALAVLLLAALLPLGAMGRGETQAEGSHAAQGSSPQPTFAQAAGPDAPSAAAVTGLPLTHVVLFTSGLGYFERDGRISGNQTVNLEFPASGINDLLASLIVRDTGGGRVTGVDYASRDPLSRTLGSFAIDLTDNPALAAILLQARGEKIKIEAPGSITGTIVSVESRAIAEPGGSTDGRSTVREAVFINLLTASGIRSINLESVSSILFLDPRLQADLSKALSLLAGDRSTDTKRVAINFAGSGTREVSVAYMAETPVWKTAYRLVIGEGASFLQGWAIVENTSSEDWRNVSLALVSGQPISFVMDLYRPIYTRRPEVSVPLPPSIMPQIYGEAMGPGAAGAGPASGAGRGAVSAERAMRESLAANRPSAAPSAAAPVAKDRRQARDEEGGSAEEAIDLSSGVEAGAVGASLGELFRYTMVDPVTIARNQSAMLPIVNQPVQGERLSIYNEGVLEQHPLAGFRIRNTTGLHLMGGPVSVFEGGAYAGEAEVGDIGPGGERIISYSVDLDVEVSARGESLPDSITEVKISRGTLIVSRTLRRERDYTIVNRAARAKELLVEYPLSSDWTLVEPARPAEQTRDLYRFAVKLSGRTAASEGKAGSTAAAGGAAGSPPTAAADGAGTGAAAPTTLRVVEERRISQSVALTNLDSTAVALYLKQQVLSAAVRDALAKLTRLRGELAELARERQGVESQISGIRSDQERIRGNMSALERSSALYKRYVAMLNGQEDALENLVSRLDTLQMRERAKQKEIDDYVGSLDLT